MLPAQNTHQLLAAIHAEGPLLFGGLWGSHGVGSYGSPSGPVPCSSRPLPSRSAA